MIKVILAGALAAAAAAGPGEEKAFGHWIAVCDNVTRCEATVLMPAGWGLGESPKLDFSREPGPGGAVTVTITPLTEAPGVIDILIDRRLMGSGVMRNGAVHLTGAAAEGMARAIAKGRALTLRSRGKTLVTISLTGSAAAMRYIDTEQGRVGGVTALVARGPKGAAAVPAAAGVPRFPAVRPAKGKAATLPPAQTEALRLGAGCGDPAPPDQLPEYHRLDGHATLAIIPCQIGPRQDTSAIYVLTGGRAVPATFDHAPDHRGKDAAPVTVQLMPAAAFDARTGTLIMRYRRYGTSICGFDQRWVWDGTRFRMTSHRGLMICNFTGNWITAYRAEPVYK